MFILIIHLYLPKNTTVNYFKHELMNINFMVNNTTSKKLLLDLVELTPLHFSISGAFKRVIKRKTVLT